MRAAACIPGRWVLLASALAAGVAGCSSSVVTSDGRPMPPAPHAPPQAPADARVSAMAIQVANKAVDTDGNGFPDQIRVGIHLFTATHPTSIEEPGAFVFRLYPFGRSVADGAPAMVEWRIDPPRAEGALVRTVIGPGYVFHLSLLEKGGDQYPLMSTNLTCSFEPADGRAPVASSEAMLVTIGRRL